jgi:hypothetical protein
MKAIRVAVRPESSSRCSHLVSRRHEQRCRDTPQGLPSQSLVREVFTNQRRGWDCAQIHAVKLEPPSYPEPTAKPDRPGDVWNESHAL